MQYFSIIQRSAKKVQAQKQRAAALPFVPRAAKNKKFTTAPVLAANAPLCYTGHAADRLPGPQKPEYGKERNFMSIKEQNKR